ncbi:hypothetical protein F5Y19DRAFT_20367 [Xylariaceae sp. FL1651]|nr:hypothetical protein F5Y19DRAFT_20367 [Xylariaceae sp. FL1651]
MQPMFVYRSQAQSQPLLPSQIHPSFRSPVPESHIQAQGPSRITTPRLSPLPRSPAPIFSARGRSILLPAQGQYQAQHQAHPYFSTEPAARGYLPQRTWRPSRHPDLEEPIVPLRQQFSVSNDVRDSNRPVPLQRINPGRPYSVSSYYTQPSRNINIYEASQIARPATISNPGTQKQPAPYHPDGTPQFDETQGHLEFPVPVPTSTSSTDFIDETIPLPRALPFLEGRQAKRRAETLESRVEAANENSSPKAAFAAIQLKARRTNEKTSSSPKPTKGKNTSAPQSNPTENSTSGKADKGSKHSNSASAVLSTVSNPSKKIKLVGRYASHTPRATLVQEIGALRSKISNKQASQGVLPSHASQVNEHHESSNESLDHVTDAVSAGGIQADNSQAKQLSQRHPLEANLELKSIETIVTTSSIPKNSCTTPSDLNPLGQREQESDTEIPRRLRPANISTLDNHLRKVSDVLIPSVMKRTASQATTVSTVSTEAPPSSANENILKAEDVFNPMSKIDEKMAIEQDIDYIVKTRFQTGGIGMLETMGAEILISMTAKDKIPFDDNLFEAVKAILD